MNDTEKKYTLEDMRKCWEQAQESATGTNDFPMGENKFHYYSFREFIECLHTDDPKIEAQPTKPESKRPVPKKITFQQLSQLLQDRLGVEEIEVQPDTKIYDDLFCDQMDQMEIELDIERDFGVRINEGEIYLHKPDNMHDQFTVKQLLDLINSKIPNIG